MDHSTEPSSARSAFQIFRQLRSKELKARNAQMGVGELSSAVAEEWKSLSPSDRERYEAFASEERIQVDEINRKKDEEYSKAQALKRSSFEVGMLEGRVRTSTAQSSEASSEKDKVRGGRPLKREPSDAVIQRREERRQQKEEQERQFQDIRLAKAEQAEARLKFLLSQSDIFAHFGIGKELAEQQELEKERKKAKEEEQTEETPMKRRMSEEEEDARMLEESEERKEDDDDFLLSQPKSVTGKLRPYQLEGLNWMIRLHKNGINGILADEMGLGKTLQSICILGYMMEYKNIRGPHIVLVPKSTLSNWMNEFARWCPSLRVVRFHGSREEREDFVQNVLKPHDGDDREWDVVVTTYEIANRERRSLSKFPWRYMIIDEAHRLKNETSQFSMTVREMETQHRLLLTGTPLQNNLHELWALLNFLLPDVFASSEQFDDWFNLDIDDDNAKQRIISQLHKLLRPFMLRRLKSDVEKSLPPKTETILFVGMSAMQKGLYRKLLQRDIAAIQGEPGTSRSAVLNIVMQLRKCCNHPYLFQGVEDRSLHPLGDHLWKNCGKMVLLDKLLTKMKERDHRVLIFTQMTRMMDIMEDYCVAKDYSYCRIDGNTSYELRESQIEEYNAPGSQKFIFLLSTRAGGLGINLQTADTCILYDSDWNPQADLQAQDRCHRIGQTKPVNVYRLVTENTVEEKIIERAQKKLKLDAMVVQQGRLQDKEKKLSKEELLDSIRYGADKVFRSQSSSISDDDIEKILEAGRKRTEAMEAALADLKGDALDFKLDGGIGSQTFEGVDYSNRKRPAGLPLFIDIGKRQRTAVNYSSSQPLESSNEGRNTSASLMKKYSKLPKHLRLPRMEEWHFYNRERLEALAKKEERLYIDYCKANKPSSVELRTIQVLSDEEVAEKQALLAEGFGNWTRSQFNAFHKGSAKYGRTAHEKIGIECNKTTEEVSSYAKAFWTRGPTSFSTADWDKLVKNIEKGERKLEEIARLTESTRRFIESFDNAWEDLVFKYTGSAHLGGQSDDSSSAGFGGANGTYHEVEDRFLLCLVNRYGYGRWEDIRLAIRREDCFRFDYFLQSCNAETLEKRCESLMYQVEKELAEREKREAAAAEGASKLKDSIQATSKAIESVALSFKKAQEAHNEVVARRARLRQEIDGRRAMLEREQAQRRAAGMRSLKIPAAAPRTRNTASEHAPPESPKLPLTRSAASGLPEALMPDLVETVARARGASLSAVVDDFAGRHNELEKAAVEAKIKEVAFQDRVPGVGEAVWCIRTTAELYLPVGATAVVRDPAEDVIPAPRQRPRSSSPKPAKRKPVSEAGPPPKKKRSDSHAESSDSTAKSAVDALQIKVPDPPKKSSSALKLFGRRMHPEIKAKYPHADKKWKVRHLRDLWESLDESERQKYRKLEDEDRARYDREYEEYRLKMKSIQEKAASGGHVKAKRAVL